MHESIFKLKITDRKASSVFLRGSLTPLCLVFFSFKKEGDTAHSVGLFWILFFFKIYFDYKVSYI